MHVFKHFKKHIASFPYCYAHEHMLDMKKNYPNTWLLKYTSLVEPRPERKHRASVRV